MEESLPPNGSAGAFVQEFRETFSSMGGLVERVLKGSTRVTHFRSLVWSVLLGVLDEEESGESFRGDWEASLGRSRARYDSLLKKHEFDVRGKTHRDSRDLERDNPLSTDSSSSWNQYFINAELREEILRDVVRTYPGNPLFRSQTMQNTLTDILFIYAKEFPCISYKQGMHEILAAVLLVIKEDMESYVLIKGDLEAAHPEMSPLFRVIFDPLYSEHDAYLLFESIMHRMVDWYWSPPPLQGASQVRTKKKRRFPSLGGLFEVDDEDREEGPGAAGPHKEVLNPSKRLEHMWNDILAIKDGKLHEHLEQLGIIPTTFGINWLKLLYSRQFFDNFAFREIWDAIFATNFILQDFVLVSMLHGIRSQLLESDNTGCNTLLVSSYPRMVNVSYIVAYSLHLFDSVRFPRPKEEEPPLHKTKVSFPPTLTERTHRGHLPKEPKEQQGPPPVHKSVELVEYLSGEDEGKQSLDALKGRISAWRTGLDFNVDFIRHIFKGEDVKEVEKFDLALSNLKQISGEMRNVLGRRKAVNRRMLTSTFGEEALNLIDK